MRGQGTMEASLDIADAISLSLAPIFLLAGIGALLNVMTARLARVVDRARLLEELIESSRDPTVSQRQREELRYLGLRIQAVNSAIFTTSMSALLVCLVVALLFVERLTLIDADAWVAVLFIATMSLLTLGLAFFLREIAVATQSLKVRTELLRDPTVS